MSSAFWLFVVSSCYTNISSQQTALLQNAPYFVAVFGENRSTESLIFCNISHQNNTKLSTSCMIPVYTSSVCVCMCMCSVCVCVCMIPVYTSSVCVFYRLGAAINVVVNFAFILTWSVVGIAVEYDKRYRYDLPEHWWRIMLFVR